MTEDTSVHPEEVWEEGMGAGGCYTNGKEARFIFNGLRRLKFKHSNRDRYPGFKTFRKNKLLPDVRKHTRLVRRAKTALLISDRSLIEPRWGGGIHLASGWLPRHNASKEDSADTQNIYRKKAPRWALQVGGEAEDQNLHGRGAQSIESTKEVSTRWPSLERGLLLWSAFDWGHHMDIKQFSDKQANKCIPISHCSPHIYSVKQSVHYQSLSRSLFCSVKWAMSSLHPSHCSLWGHSRNTRTLTNPRLSETVSSRPKEIERERASKKKVSWFQLTHHTFPIHCKGYFPIKRMNYVFKMLIRRNCKQSKLCKTKADVI